MSAILYFVNFCCKRRSRKIVLDGNLPKLSLSGDCVGLINLKKTVQYKKYKECINMVDKYGTWCYLNIRKVLALKTKEC